MATDLKALVLRDVMAHKDLLNKYGTLKALTGKDQQYRLDCNTVRIYEDVRVWSDNFDEYFMFTWDEINAALLSTSSNGELSRT